MFDLDDFNAIDEVVYDAEIPPSRPAELHLPPKDDNVASRTRSRTTAPVLPLVNNATVSQNPSLIQFAKLVPTALLFLLMTPLLKDPAITSNSVAGGSEPLNLGGG